MKIVDEDECLKLPVDAKTAQSCSAVEAQHLRVKESWSFRTAFLKPILSVHQFYTLYNSRLHRICLHNPKLLRRSANT